jgi:hypothetical protein
LSDAAVKVIERAAAWRASDKYIFPGRYNSPFSSTAMAPALAWIGVGYSRHGWRSVWRDYCGEIGDIPRDVAEFQLAHITQGVEGAYRRMTALEARRVHVQRYSDWLNGIESASNVVPLKASA